MKKMKKIVSILLTAVMVLAMAATVFADTATYSLTISDTKEGHTYAVYQIFTGDISGAASNYILSNVKYGSNYGTQGEAVPEDVLSAITDADTFAQDLETHDDPFKTQDSTAGSTVISGLPAGYYLVKDSKPVTGQDAATKFILKVVGNTTVTVKSDAPTVQKKVQENKKTFTETTGDRIPDYALGAGYNDVADYNIGDNVPFELVGTLPSKYDDYKTYKYYFHDTLSLGLTYNNDAKITIDTADGTEITDLFTIVSNGTSLEIKCENLKANKNITKDSKIVVRYTAKLNANAVIGLDGNPNEVTLEFSNNPNKGGEGETGTTPKDEVIVFTYELDTTKVDGKDTSKKLQDAEFKLKNADGKWATVVNDKVTGWVDTEEAATVLKSDVNGLFKVIGLDAGTYYLKETKAPEGYNLLTNEIQLEVIATTSNNQSWDGTPNKALTALKIKVGDDTTNGDCSTGIVNTTVENNKGATLPETGGIGTTIFYVIGTVLVLGAVVLLVTKRRMNVQK